MARGVHTPLFTCMCRLNDDDDDDDDNNNNTKNREEY